MLIGLVITLLVTGILAAITLSLTSSGLFQSTVSTADLQAYYAAESGMRYAAMRYLNTANTGGATRPGDLSADDEKAALLKDRLDGRTFTLPGTGAGFTFEVYANWFVVMDRNGTFQLELPGRVPDGFALPETGTLAIGDELYNPVYVGYTGGEVTADGVFHCTGGLTSADLLPHLGKPAYVTLDSPDYGVGISCKNYGQDSFYLPCSNPGLFPPAGGRVEIRCTRSPPTYNYQLYYAFTSFDPVTQLLTFHYPVDANTLAKRWIILWTQGQSTLHLKKAMTLRVIGRTGREASGFTRRVDYAVPIGDSIQAEQTVLLVIDPENPAVPDQFVSPDGLSGGPATLDVTRVGGTVVSTVSGQVDVDWYYAVQMKNLLERSDPGETNPYCHGAAVFADTDRIDGIWKLGRRLEYDIQMKFGTMGLSHAAQGVEFRKQRRGTSAEGIGLYQGYGVSLMAYYSPSIVFTNGASTKGIGVGDWICYFAPAQMNEGAWVCGTGEPVMMTRARVDAILDFQGSWSSGTAQGRLLLTGHTLERVPESGAFCGPDTFFREGDPIFDETGVPLAVAATVDIPPGGFNDRIPDSLKPPGMGSWFHGNPGYGSLEELMAMDAAGVHEGVRLLLVLWQQRVVAGVEQRRWLACKDMTHDAHVMPEIQADPTERIFRAFTGLLLRVRESEKGLDKLNEVEVFYSDAKAGTSGRAKTPYPHDYGDDRMGYRPGFTRADGPESSGCPLWPPDDLSLWNIGYDSIDYVTHLEKPESVSQADRFQWDLLRSTTGTVESWDGDGQAVFRLEDDGRLMLSDFTTPDTGSYAVNEFALSGHFDGSRRMNFDSQQPGETVPASLSYLDMAVLFIDQGHFKGGFLRATQY
jgi:hypothetical protein